MDEQEFDKFAEEYKSLHTQNIQITGENPEYFAAYKIKELSSLCRQIAPNFLNLDDAPSILDFGCGVGAAIQQMLEYLPHAKIIGTDVSQKSLEIARDLYGDKASFLHYNGTSLPFKSDSLDIVFTACVFHHIPPKERAQQLKEIHRVLKPGGLFINFEHNPWNPLTLRAVNTCPFDENAELLSAPSLKKLFNENLFKQANVRYTLFFPRVLAKLRFLEPFLRWLPLGAQYYVWATKK